MISIHSRPSLEFLEGSIHFQPSFDSPWYDAFVTCMKHGEVVSFNYGELDFRNDANVLQAAREAIERGCSYCVYARQVAESRFPEGAEI